MISVGVVDNVSLPQFSRGNDTAGLSRELPRSKLAAEARTVPGPNFLSGNSAES